MTDQQHPITPPPELVQQWDDEGTEMFRPEYQLHLAARAAQWGADQELEACCEWTQGYAECGDSLRAARRPKPPSLKEQAFKTLNFMESEAPYDKPMFDTIRRALEALPE
jgi:hypothetical protein